jgi:protein tyrosine phosphatase (PTP) superfamily phosphohydrolase (DUF442 family)
MDLPRKIVVVACVVGVVAAGFCSGAETNAAAAKPAKDKTQQAPKRPANWAQKLERPGAPNLYQVTTNLYRGAQPTAQGVAQLKAMGVKTVINLRPRYSDQDAVAGTGLKSVRFGTEAWHTDREDVVGFLKIVSDTNNLPAFVHCQRGADRTGMMCAMYRVVVCNWTKQDAIQEMKDGGFGFNPLWKNLATFIEKADVDELKQEAGIVSKKKMADGK